MRSETLAKIANTKTVPEIFLMTSSEERDGTRP